MHAILWLIGTILDLLIWVFIINAALSWLIAFGAVNIRNRFVAMLEEFTRRITEPLLRPIRRFIPNLGGIDISPMVLILLVMFIQRLIYELLG